MRSLGGKVRRAGGHVGSIDEAAQVRLGRANPGGLAGVGIYQARSRISLTCAGASMARGLERTIMFCMAPSAMKS